RRGLPSGNTERNHKPSDQLRSNIALKPGSEKGTSPFSSSLSFAWFLSMHATSAPDSAKQTPSTNPTYPEPTTATFTLSLAKSVLSGGALRPARWPIQPAETFAYAPYTRNGGQ